MGVPDIGAKSLILTFKISEVYVADIDICRAACRKQMDSAGKIEWVALSEDEILAGRAEWHFDILSFYGMLPPQRLAARRAEHTLPHVPLPRCQSYAPEAAH